MYMQPNSVITRHFATMTLKVDVPWLAGKGGAWASISVIFDQCMPLISLSLYLRNWPRCISMHISVRIYIHGLVFTKENKDYTDDAK